MALTPQQQIDALNERIAELEGAFRLATHNLTLCKIESKKQREKIARQAMTIRKLQMGAGQ